MVFPPRAVSALASFEERLSWAMMVFPAQQSGWPRFDVLVSTRVSQPRDGYAHSNHAAYFGLLALYDVSEWTPLKGANKVAKDEPPLRPHDEGSPCVLQGEDRTKIQLKGRYSRAITWFKRAVEEDSPEFFSVVKSYEPWFALFVYGARIPADIAAWIRQQPAAEHPAAFSTSRVRAAIIASGGSPPSVGDETSDPWSIEPDRRERQDSTPVMTQSGSPRVIRGRSGELTSLDGELSSVPGAVIDVRARVVALQVDDEIEIAWVGHATAREIPWPEPIEAVDVDEVLAVATAGGTDAHVVTTGPGGTLLGRATQDGRLRQVRLLSHEPAAAAVIHRGQVLLVHPVDGAGGRPCAAFRSADRVDYLDAAYSAGRLTVVAGEQGATTYRLAGVHEPVVSPSGKPIQEVRVVRQLDPRQEAEIRVLYLDGTTDVGPVPRMSPTRRLKGWT